MNLLLLIQYFLTFLYLFNELSLKAMAFSSQIDLFLNDLQLLFEREVEVEVFPYLLLAVELVE